MVVEEVSLPSRPVEIHEEPMEVVAESTSQGPKEAMSQIPGLNSDTNPSTNAGDNQPLPENNLPCPIEQSKDESNDSVSTDQALEAALQEAVRAEADSHSHDSDEMDMEVSYAPDPAQLAPELSSEIVEEENRSPEYSPNLHRTAPEVPDRESDDYEPPDATIPTDAPESPPFSPAPPESIHKLADETMQDVNSMQALDEDGHSTTEEIQPLLNGSSQQLLEVNNIFIA